MVRNPQLVFGCLILANFASAFTSAWGADRPQRGANGETSVAFAPDSKWLVTGGTDGLVRIREGTTGAVLAGLAGHESNVNGVAISPDGRTIASVSSDFSVRLWDVERRVERKKLVIPRSLTNGYQFCVLAVAFSPDGQTLATGDNGCYIQLWDVESGAMGESWVGDGKRIDQLLYSPDGAMIASVGRDPAVKLWDARSHTLRRSLSEPGNSRLHIAYSPDGTTLAVSRNMTLNFWNPETGALKNRLRDSPDVAPSLTFTPDNEFLILANCMGSHLLSIKQLTNDKNRSESILPPPYIDECSAIATSPDGRWVAHCFCGYGKFPQSPFKLIAIR